MKKNRQCKLVLQAQMLGSGASYPPATHLQAGIEACAGAASAGASFPCCTPGCAPGFPLQPPARPAHPPVLCDLYPPSLRCIYNHAQTKARSTIQWCLDFYYYIYRQSNQTIATIPYAVQLPNANYI